MGGQGGQILPDRPDPPGHRPVQAGRGQRRALPPGGLDGVHHRLGLGQADTAVFKGAAGELPRPGGPGARRQAGLHQPLGHGAAPVAAQLHHILAGVAAGRAETQGHRLVQHRTVRPQAVAEQGGIPLGLAQFAGGVGRAKDLFRNGIGLGAADAHHRDAPHPRRGGQGADGGRKIHGHGNFLLAGKHGKPRAGAWFSRKIYWNRTPGFTLRQTLQGSSAAPPSRISQTTCPWVVATAWPWVT